MMKQRDISFILQQSKSYELPFPYPGKWALALDSCRFLAEVIHQLKPDSVIEFGSGYSSLIIAEELRKNGAGILHSIDNSRTWSERARESASKYAAGAYVHFFRFPLGLRFYGGQPSIGFRIPRAFYAGKSLYDVAFIDAPHVDVNRDGSLYEIAPHMKTGGLIICDDCNAEYMKWTLARWEERYRGCLKIQLISEIGNGIGLLVWTRNAGLPSPAFRINHFIPAIFRTIRNYFRIHRLHMNS